MPRTYWAAIPSYKLNKKMLAMSHIHKYIYVNKLYKKSLAGSHLHKYMYWNLNIISMFNVHVGVLFNRNNTIFVRYNLHIQAMKLSLPTLLRTGSNCRYHFSSDKNDLQCTVYMDIRIFFMQIPWLWFISFFFENIWNGFVCPPWHSEACILYILIFFRIVYQNVFSFNVPHVPYICNVVWVNKRTLNFELWNPSVVI